MTKADIVAKISEKLGLEKGDIQATIETFITEVKNSRNRRQCLFKRIWEFYCKNKSRKNRKKHFKKHYH